MVTDLPRPAPVLGWAGLAGQVVFALAVAFTPALQPRYDWTQEDVSALFARDAVHPWAMASAVVVLGLGTIAIGVGLRGTLERGEAADIGRILVLGLGLAICLAGVFHNDCSTAAPACAARVRAGHVSWQHHVHDAVSGLIFLLLLASPLVLAHAFRLDARWDGMYRWSLATGLVGLALLAAYLLAPSDGGVLERLAIGLPVLWLASVSWRLIRSSVTIRRAVTAA